MQISLNGQDREVTEGATVSQLLGDLELSGPLAVEINRQVCPKRLHDEKTLNAGDVLEIVTIVGGG